MTSYIFDFFLEAPGRSIPTVDGDFSRAYFQSDAWDPGSSRVGFLALAIRNIKKNQRLLCVFLRSHTLDPPFFFRLGTLIFKVCQGSRILAGMVFVPCDGEYQKKLKVTMCVCEILHSRYSRSSGLRPLRAKKYDVSLSYSGTTAWILLKIEPMLDLGLLHRTTKFGV